MADALAERARRAAAGQRPDSRSWKAARCWSGAAATSRTCAGRTLPPSADAAPARTAGAPFEAMGVSLVFHPRNPYVPTVHMNVRMLAATPAAGPDAPVVLVRRRHGPHAVLRLRGRRRALPPDVQPRRAGAFRRGTSTRASRQWCDEYFFLKHRNEPRGIGGVFFDDFTERWLRPRLCA